MSQMSFETFGLVMSSYIPIILLKPQEGKEESNKRNVSKSGLKYTWSFILNMCSVCMNSFQIDL